MAANEDYYRIIEQIPSGTHMASACGRRRYKARYSMSISRILAAAVGLVLSLPTSAIGEPNTIERSGKPQQLLRPEVARYIRTNFEALSDGITVTTSKRRVKLGNSIYSPAVVFLGIEQYRGYLVDEQGYYYEVVARGAKGKSYPVAVDGERGELFGESSKSKITFKKAFRSMDADFNAIWSEMKFELFNVGSTPRFKVTLDGKPLDSGVLTLKKIQ